MPGDVDRRLLGIVALSFNLRVVTGLRIGGADATIAIGGQENVIVRDPLSGQPFVPGSSVKGKIRSLIERVRGLEQNQPIQEPRVFIHTCRNAESYKGCIVCQLFGTPAPERERWFCQTRLRFSDIRLTVDSERQLRLANTELPYTEVKSEAAIDRMTSAAVPRTMERVPAGAEFGPGRITMLQYDGDDAGTYLEEIVSGLELLEADFLGAAGSRGSGRVQCNSLAVSRKRFRGGSTSSDWEAFGQTFADIAAARSALRDVQNRLRE